MTFSLIWPSGVADGQVIEAAELEDLDVDHSKAINGVDGDTAAGPLELSDCDLTGTSSIDISGPIETTAQISTTTNLIVGGAGAFNTIEVAVSLESPVVSFLEGNGRTALVDRVVPRTIGTQTINTVSATVLALDFTAQDTWVITLNNGASSALCAVLSTVATLVDTSGTPELEVKPGAKISITFKAGGAQAGGIGLSSTVFPASFHGMTVADLVGPRTGAVTGTGGTNDWMRLDLENIGTAGAPKYSVTITMGAG